ncbi:VOC family protein [Falsibacillus albus]|uniref:Glyoxalase/bleomycin resistance/dioxygenase family protein n=1 Tax=Falsibacillus albus TaxID=2478915 RepID=A0A3L7JVI2_9BACI|nr:VOC family protein [Falsibacillus albus]RLQ93671.1 glyoxalase/bleomycin resistance/dioxygenase family protein [Falsibacillus albus]
MSIFRNPQIVLLSSDVVRAATFYQGLGFTETFRVPNDGEPIHIDLVLDDYRIGIASVNSTRDDHGLAPLSQGQRAAVILWTDDTAAAFETIISKGAEPLVSPYEWLGRLLIAWVADPDGNPIQIVQNL